MKPPSYRRAGCAALIPMTLALTPLMAGADEPNKAELEAPPVEVLGFSPSRSQTQVTEDISAAPASVTVFEKRDLDRKTITTYGDIFRGTAGVSILEYGQGLVAYDIQMRGFDGGHGNKIAVSLDGMPLNVTGSQHTNGYMDLAQVIPELLSRVELVRGPFSVFAGNHAVAGSVQFHTDTSPLASVKFTIDSFGRARVVPIENFDIGPGNLMVALDATKGPTYTDQSNLQRLNLFTRYAMPLGSGIASLRLQLYDADAEAPGYINAEQIRTNQISPKAALSRGIGDAKNQQNLVFNFRSDDAEGAGGFDTGWFISAYLNNDTRRRWTNFNLATPLGSSVPLGSERDHLQQLGFDVRKTTSFDTIGLPSQLVAGVQINSERLEARNYQSDADRNFIGGTIGIDRRIVTDTRALYAQYQLQPIPRLKLTAGGRYDYLSFNLLLRPDDATFASAQPLGADTVNSSASQFSPKVGAAFTVWEGAAANAVLFANAARGLKSPYAFSDFYSNLGLNPPSARFVPDLSISKVTSYEAGLQGGALDNSFAWRVSFWDTKQDGEQDRNAVGVFQNFKKTNRDGFDLEGSLLVADATRVFANYSQVRARIENPVVAGFDRIPNVAEYIGTVGILSAQQFGRHRFDVTLADSLVGPQSIIADNSVRSSAYHRSNLRVAYSKDDWKGATVFVNFVTYSRQLDELTFDFGGGQFGVSPRPRLAATVGVQIPL